MPKKTAGGKGKKANADKQHKRAEAKKARGAQRKERAEKRKAFRMQANAAYESWRGGHLHGVVEMCTSMQAQLLESYNANKKQLVGVTFEKTSQIAAKIDEFMLESVTKLAHHKNVNVDQIVVAPVAVKPPTESHIPLKNLIHWYGIAKKNALLLEQFNSHANRRNPNPAKPTKAGFEDSRPERSPQEQEWLALQDKATKGIHLRKKGRKATAEKVEEAKEVVAEVRHDSQKAVFERSDFRQPVYGESRLQQAPRVFPGSLSSRRTQYPTFNLG